MTTTNAIAVVPQQTTNPITALRDAMNTAFHEREQAVDAILTALIAREHVVLLGRPGTGKSALSRAVSGALDATYFEYLFTRFSTPEEFLGPFSLKGLEQDIYKRNTTGYLPDAHVAFLDEIFKANSASLNTLLPILNERAMHNGGKVQTVPLDVCIAASNEMPQGEELGALWDRFLLRVEVEPVRGSAERKALLAGAASGARIPAMPQVDAKALTEAIVEASKLPVPDAVIDALLELRSELEREGIVHGDRRWQKAVKLLKAYALVIGDQMVDTDHFAVLESALWDAPEQRAKVREVIGRMAAPALVVARKTFDTVMSSIQPTVDNATNASNSAQRSAAIGEAMQQLKNAITLLKKQRTEARDGSRACGEIDRLISKATDKHGELKQVLLKGLNVSL